MKSRARYGVDRLSNEAAVQFLLRLFDGVPGAVELTAIKPKGSTSHLPYNTWTDFIPEHYRGVELGEALLNMQALNEQAGFGVYYGTTVRRAVLPSGAGVDRGKEESALYAPCLWADMDFKATDKRPERSLSELVLLLSQMETPPSIAISTGGGVQALWLLEQPLDCTHYSASRVKLAIHKGLQAFVGSDSVANGDRVMRLPYYYNTKRETWVFVEVLWEDWVMRYALDAFERYVTAEPRPVARVVDSRDADKLPLWIAELLMSPPAQGERNATLYRMAATLKDIGWTQDRAAEVLRGFAGLDDRETEQTIKSAFTKAPRGRVAESRDDLRSIVRRSA
jgi:hypothetical protein